jgi:hypothetical protein
MDQPLCSYYTFPSARSPEKEEETTTKTPTLEEVGGKGKSRFKNSVSSMEKEALRSIDNQC